MNTDTNNSDSNSNSNSNSNEGNEVIDVHGGNPQMPTAEQEQEQEQAVQGSLSGVEDNTKQKHHQIHQTQQQSHTLDEADLGTYPSQLRLQIQQAMATHNKENAMRVAIVLYDTSVSNKTIRAMPSIISQCRLVAITVLQPTQKSASAGDDSNANARADPNADAKQWLKENGSGYPILDTSTPSNSPNNNNNNKTMLHASTVSTVQVVGHDFDNTAHADLSFHRGTHGYQEMLALPTIDAVYVLCPMDCHSSIVCQALNARKHVLVHDPQSTTLQDFQTQVRLAAKVKRFVQFSTLLQHQHQVRTFLDSVTFQMGTQHLERMHFMLHAASDCLDRVGVGSSVTKQQQQQELQEFQQQQQQQEQGNNKMLSSSLLMSNASSSLSLSSASHHRQSMSDVLFQERDDNCIRRLARYGVLCALLLLQQKANSQPTAVQVQSSSVNAQGVMIRAKGTVWFTNGRELTFDVGYSRHGATRTRQVLEVHAADRYAVLNDVMNDGDYFDNDDCDHTAANPKTCSLPTYRIYQKCVVQQLPAASSSSAQRRRDAFWQRQTSLDENIEFQVTGGHAVDVLSGPPMAVAVWRRFAQMCRAVEQQEGQEEKEKQEQRSSEQQQTSWVCEDGEMAQLQQQADWCTVASMQLKDILNQLEESQRQGHVRIPLTGNWNSNDDDDDEAAAASSSSLLLAQTKNELPL